MKFFSTSLKGVYIIGLEPVADSRGWFTRTFCKKEFQQIGHDKEWVQMNHSATAIKGTIRGLHYQVPPSSEIKMIRCVSGVIFDVIVDLRKDSETFLQWKSIILSKNSKTMVYIPEGCAHGFQTLADDCELIYHHTAYYTPEAEAGIRFDDPSIGIQWPEPCSMISDRDMSYSFLDKSFKGV